MKIIVVNVNIEDICYGNCFKWNYNYWIKSNNAKENDGYFNCVELEAGNQRWFKAGDKVEKIGNYILDNSIKPSGRIGVCGLSKILSLWWGL
uniref:Uncharacterized protein n=1 Tax=viral metagenome TaxID=1070528 RepID=A0A6M3JJ43_9ZZZZ